MTFAHPPATPKTPAATRTSSTNPSSRKIFSPDSSASFAFTSPRLRCTPKTQTMVSHSLICLDFYLEKSRFISNFFLEDTPNHIKVVRSMTTRKDVSNEKNEMENSHFSDMAPTNGKEPSALRSKKNAKELAKEFPHSQCFFLCYKEKYIVLSRILYKKFYVDAKGGLARTQEVFSDYLAQRLKKYQMILQFGGFSDQLTKKVTLLDFLILLNSASSQNSLSVPTHPLRKV